MRGLLIAILIFICASCTTTKYIDKPIPIETVRTEYINQLYRDSVFVHDSIDRYVKGDTVYQYKYKYISKYLNKTDTVIKTDSIQVPVEVKITEIKEVNKIRWYQSTLMWLGGIFLIILSFIIGRKLRTII